LRLLQDQLGQDKINYLSQVTNLALFHHVSALTALYPQVVKEYVDFAPTLPIVIDGRYASAFFSTFTLMSYVGVNWKKFFYDWVVANEDTITRATSVRESDTVLKDMLYASVIRQDDRENPVCVAQLLATPDSRENINTASVGMFYDTYNKLLLIMIPQALPKLLNRPGQLPMTQTRLKDILDRHPAALTTKEVLQSGILSRITRYIGAAVEVQDVVVLHAEQWLGKTTIAPATPVLPPTPVQTPKNIETTNIETTSVETAITETTPVVKETVIDAPSANPNDYEFRVKD